MSRNFSFICGNFHSHACFTAYFSQCKQGTTLSCLCTSECEDLRVVEQEELTWTRPQSGRHGDFPGGQTPELGDQVSPAVLPVWERLLCGPGWRTQPEHKDMEPAGQRGEGSEQVAPKHSSYFQYGKFQAEGEALEISGRSPASSGAGLPKDSDLNRLQT